MKGTEIEKPQPPVAGSTSGGVRIALMTQHETGPILFEDSKKRCKEWQKIVLLSTQRRFT